MKRRKFSKKVEIIRKENIGKKGMAFRIRPGSPVLDCLTRDGHGFASYDP